MSGRRACAGRAALLASVFLTGAAVLILEIAAARVLSPHFGSTLFTFSSVITTILAALACGYYLGGRVSDRWPSGLLFHGLIAAAGLAVVLQQGLTAAVLPLLAQHLSMVEGPLVSSLFLFLLPALLLGMLSPFAIQLLAQRKPGRGVGEVAGAVFFWSTLGSIAGSLAAGFWLIPWLGTGAIVLWTAAGLLALGGAGLLAHAGARARLLGTAAAGAAAGCVLAAAWPSDVDAPGLLHSQAGLYGQLRVTEHEVNGRTVRLLMQDANASSGMFTDDAGLAFGYTRYFELYRLFMPDLRRALVLGGGAYSVPQALLRQTDADIDVAEVEPDLLPIARRYFGLADSPRLRNHVADGRRVLRDSAGGYDLIFSDVYASFAAVPPQFVTREFFMLARSRLGQRGVFIANHVGSLAPTTRPLLLSIHRTMQEAFAHVHVIATRSARSDELQNFIFIGQVHGEPVDLARARHLDFVQPGLRDCADRLYRPDPAQLAAARVYTDDHAPVEHHAAEFVRLYASQRRVDASYTPTPP